MARAVTGDRRRSHRTADAVVFVVGLSFAGAVLLFLSIPVVWAIIATVGIAVMTVRRVRDIHGNRAM